MRFTNFILAAGLTASALAAPVAVQEQDDSCPIDVEPESTSITSVVPTTIPATTSPTIAPSSTQVVVTSSSAVVASSSAVVTSSSAVVASSSASPAASSKAASSGKLQWIGANESGAEFGQGNIPGTEGTDYTFPSTSAIQTLIDGGMNIFRIPFLMERIAQGTMTASLDAAYVASIKTVVDYITAAGAHAILDAQNFGRYHGTLFTSTSDFGTFWKNVATEFADNDLVIFDCNNEFHDEPTNTIVAELNQACVSAVRSAGATSQYIFVEGTSYTGAWTWTSSGNAQYMANITDPNDKLVYEFHQYLDSDGSGTSATCVSSTIGAERVADATQWLKANNFKGILGEFAGGVNPTCETAVKGLLDALAADSEVWMGALWWGAGPWWGDYIFAMEPPSGSAYTAYFDTIASYVA